MIRPHVLRYPPMDLPVTGDPSSESYYAETMSTFVGTSGFSYTAWSGIFYPPKLPAAKRLSYYASQFSAVEINNTFYRMPNVETLAKWRDQTPGRFVFVLKAPGLITHTLKLRNTAQPMTRFARLSEALERKRGPVLFQLPPTLQADIPLLRDFLTALPAGLRAAFEFRHDSWLNERVFAALHAANAALCIADTEERATPWEPTADWGYLRLRRLDYERYNLEGWARRIEDADWETSYVFFKHEDAAKGPSFARTFQEILVGGEEMPEPSQISPAAPD